MQEEREQREQYMDSLEQQMEEQREQIDRTLERTTENSERRRKALEKLRSALPGLPRRTTVRGVPEREEPIEEPIGSETPSAREESPRKRSEPRSWWRRMFGGS
jgi:seryl-tRNA synthetase